MSPTLMSPTLMSPTPMSPQDPTSAITRDFTYLRHPQNFHPLPSQSLPPAFRSSQPPPTTPLSTLLSTGHFRSAAITAANTLTDTSHDLPPAELFRLWYIRLASLTLIGSTSTAAQEIKVLSDLSSNFYRDPDTSACLLPWELRVLAVRLQAIGFSDWRRSIGLYYELAREARTEVLSPTSTPASRTLWRRRLQDLGVRVANALVEMGDLKAAGRHLESLRDAPAEDTALVPGMLCLLYIRVGNLAAARQCLPRDTHGDRVLDALFLMSEARWQAAVEAWEAVVVASPETADLAKSNLAVCLLYTGRLEEVCLFPLFIPFCVDVWIRPVRSLRPSSLRRLRSRDSRLIWLLYMNCAAMTRRRSRCNCRRRSRGPAGRW